MDINALLDLYKTDPRTQQIYDIINDKDARKVIFIFYPIKKKQRIIKTA